LPDVWERCRPEINSPALENVSQSQAISCPRGGLHSRTVSLDSKAITQSIEGEGRSDKVLSKGKHLFHKFIGFSLMQNLMLECRHLGFCR
jgi:hypothetical protein